MPSAPIVSDPEPAVHRPGFPRTGRRFSLLAVVLIVLLYIGASSGPALFDQNEAQYAGAVREMLDRPQDYQAQTRGQLERGHWYVPTNDGIPRLQKPPLVYWCLWVSMRVLGVNEFAARLPNALVSLLWFGATFLLGCRWLGPRHGLAGAIILATMAGTFIFAHLIAPEPFLAAFVTLTFWCFVRALSQPVHARRWMFYAWVFMALGVFSKGLHGALYPLAVAAWLAWRQPATRPVWKQLWQPAGLAAFLLILVPWYVAIAIRYPGFLHDQFINEQLGHVINRRFPADNDRVPIWLFCTEHLVFFLPWTFFMPAALQNASLTHRAASPVAAIAAAWFVVTAVTLLFSSLQDYYLMSAWAPVALWLARPWAVGRRRQHTRTVPRWIWTGPGWCLIAVGMIVAAVAVFLTIRTPPSSAAPAAAGSAQRDTIAATVGGFSSVAWHQIMPIAWSASLAFLLGGSAVLIYARRSDRWAILTATALTMVAVLVCADFGLNALEDYLSLKTIALTANQLPGEVICAGEPADNPSLLFYLNRAIYWVHAHAAGEFASRELGIGRGLFLTEADVAQRWLAGQPTLLITEASEVPIWQSLLHLTPQEAKPIARSGTRVLISNGGGISPDKTRGK